MHINSLCACWHPEAMKGSSSSSSCRLLILPRITSSLFPCPGSTDAPCSRLGDPVPPSSKWRPHSQGPRTLPHRDPEQVLWRTLFAHQRLNQLVQWPNPFSPAIEKTILILVGETKSFWVSVPVEHSWATALRELTPASALRHFES
jgi:hypothetical protein